MKTRLLACIVAAAACVTAVSCSDNEPIKRPVQFDLPAGLTPDIARNEVVVFHTQPELDAAFGSEAAKLPKVDFKNASLAMATGLSDYGIISLDHSMTADGDGGYVLDVTVTENFATVVLPWTIAYIMPKGVSEGDISLHVTHKSGS